jgi:hypothetical protein
MMIYKMIYMGRLHGHTAPPYEVMIPAPYSSNTGSNPGDLILIER